MAGAIKKVEKIRQIVQLKQLVRRWRATSLRLGSDLGQTPVRSGHLAVYVGPDRCRFVIPTRFINFPVFTALLDRAEEEYGFNQPAGGLAIPCDPVFFGWILGELDRDEARFKSLGLETWLDRFGESRLGGAGSSACKESVAYSVFTPLLSTKTSRLEGF